MYRLQLVSSGSSPVNPVGQLALSLSSFAEFAPKFGLTSAGSHLAMDFSVQTLNSELQ